MAELAELYTFKKKRTRLGGERGRLIAEEHRSKAVELIDEALTAKARFGL